MAETATKMNRSGGSHSGWFDTPYAFRKTTIMRGGKMRKLTPTGIIVYSSIHSLETNDKACKFTYQEICRRYRLTESSVGRAVRELLEAGLITRDESCVHNYRTGSTEEEKKAPRYLHYQEWIYHATFGDGKYLSRNEISVLFYLISWNKTQDGKELSNSDIARDLNIQKTTVGKCLEKLKGYKLVFQEGSSVNAFIKAKFSVNGKLLREKEKEVVKRAKGKNERVKALDDKADRERWYAERQNEANRRADQMKDRARADAAYKDADDRVRRLEPNLAKAERISAQSAAEILKALSAAKLIRAERLCAIGLTEEDLSPRWSCPICNDTGYRNSDKLPCNCYDRRGIPK